MGFDLSPPYTMEQMMTRAIMSIQLTGLYSQALIEWQQILPVNHTWDALKLHFTRAYIAREQSGTGTTAANGYLPPPTPSPTMMR